MTSFINIKDWFGIDMIGDGEMGILLYRNGWMSARN